MRIQNRPYLVVPFLIEQPTWGGEYICEKKEWLNKPELVGKKIGQSYELYSKSLLALEVFSSRDPLFSPNMTKTLPVSVFADAKPFPLIKFTQAKGNSFQLHVPARAQDPFWRPKAESWYFFENGRVTLGIKKSADIAQYKKTCIDIETKMKSLSEMLISGKLSRKKAEEEAAAYIKEKNPWQFVNLHDVRRGDVVDLSGGGIHHSWEEDENNPLGNIVFEVQQDVMDPVSTIRSFDQGKFLKDGSIRRINIEEYFKYLDTQEERNTLTRGQSGSTLFNTSYYVLKKIERNEKLELTAEKSFHHLFIKEGEVVVTAKEGEVRVAAGHSCFVPKGVAYTIEIVKKAEILQTSII